MSLKNSSTHYGYIAQVFHWVIALSFLVMFIFAEVMMGMTTSPENSFLGLGKWGLYGLHKSVGITLLVLIVLRILWRISNPNVKTEGNKLQIGVAHLTHFGLYAAMLAFPISGYIMSSAGGHDINLFGLFTLPNIFGINKPLAGIGHEVHEITASAVYILVALHIAGALYHHYLLKDNTLLRMIWRNKA